MSNRHPTAKKPDNSDNLEVVVKQSALFSGPLPPPQVLKEYGTSIS
jgi:hypothetical protein